MEDVIELTRKLIQIESTNPGAGEGSLGALITNYLQGCGCTVDTLEVFPGRYNILARLQPEHNGNPALIFSCHMDTVVVGEGWRQDPFRAEIRDDRLYGRGACDMKSGLACALSVFRETARLARQGLIKLIRPFCLLCSVDEEGDMTGIERAIEANWVSSRDLVLDTEPTDGQIQMAHKGRLWLVFDICGITAHASRPELGADAVAAAGELITALRRFICRRPEDPELGRSTVTFGQIAGGYQPYVVPDHCRIWTDLRLSPSTTAEDVFSYIEILTDQISRDLPGIKIHYTVEGNRPCIESNPDSHLLCALRQAAAKVTGTPPVLAPFPGYTDTAVIAGKLGNQECLSYGPGSLSQAHKPDESVPLKDILRCQRVLRQLTEELLISKI